jgi:hypothetical protein
MKEYIFEAVETSTKELGDDGYYFTYKVWTVQVSNRDDSDVYTYAKDFDSKAEAEDASHSFLLRVTEDWSPEKSEWWSINATDEDFGFWMNQDLDVA